MSFEIQKATARRQVSGISLPYGWDDVWVSALRNHLTAPAYLTVIGLSNGMGYGTSDYFAKNWISQLRDLFATNGFRILGEFWPPYHSYRGTFNGWGQDWLGNAWQGTPPWVFAVSPTWQVGGYGRLPVYTASNATVPLMTFTIPASYGCVQMSFRYYGIAASGTFQYRVDGGALQTVTVAAGPNDVSGGVLSGLNPANSHSIEFGNTSGSRIMNILGVFAQKRSDNTGIALAHLTFSGSEMVGNWGQMGTDTFAQEGLAASGLSIIPADLCLQLQGYASGTSYDGSNASATSVGFPMKPHLLITETLGNDIRNARGPDACRYTLRRLIHAARRGRPNCAILNTVPWLGNYVDNLSVPSDASADMNFGIPYSQSWSRYREVIADLTQGYGAAYVDFQSLWSESRVGTYYTTTDFHASDAGAANMASTLYAALTASL